MQRDSVRFLLRALGLAILPIVGVLHAQTVISFACPTMQTIATFKAGDRFQISTLLGEDPAENQPAEGIMVVTAYDNGTVVRSELSLLIPQTPPVITDPAVVAASNGTVKACFDQLDGDETPTVTFKLLSSISSIKVAPAPASIPLKGSQQFGVIGVFSDGSIFDVTAQTGWTSSAPSVATISAAGKATGVSPGTTTITASLGPATTAVALSVLNVASGQLSLNCAPSGGPATVGVHYTAICAAEGGVAPYSWSLATGSFPAGVAIVATAGASITIAGTPSVAGVYAFSVTATDSSAQPMSVSQSFSGTVASQSLSVSMPFVTLTTALGSASVAQSVTIASNPPGMAYVASGAPECLWLHLSGASGMAPGTLSISGDSALVDIPGTYNCNVTVGPANGGPSLSVYVSFFVTGVHVNANPTALNFTYTSGGGQPAPQSFTVVSDSLGTVAFSTAVNCGWVNVSPASGSVPGNVSISVNPGNMAPGAYQCPVAVNIPSGANRPVVMVNLLVASPPVVFPTSLSLTAVSGAKGVVSRSVGIGGPASPLGFTAKASADNGGGWLSVDMPTGATPTNLTVLADPSNLASGTYHGTVSIAFSGGQPPLSVDVTFAVGNVTATAVPSALTFHFAQGQVPVPQIVSVIASDGSTPKLTATSSGPIAVTPGPGPQSLTILPSAALAAGAYSNASVTITTGSTPQQQVVPVMIVVDPPAPDYPVLSLSSSGLNFSFAQGGSAGTQTLTVSNTGGGAITIFSSVGTNGGGNWLSANCTPTPIQGGTQGHCNVTVDPTMVIPNSSGSVSGTYSGQLTIESDALGQRAIVPVTMTLSSLPLIVLSSNALSFSALSAASTPPSGTLQIANGGPSTLKWTATASTVVSGGSWLKLGASAGTAGSTYPSALQVTVDPTQLPGGSLPGQYYGSVLISATDAVTGQPAANSPRIVTIVMNLGAPGSHANPVIRPAGLAFSAASGSAAVPSQTLSIAGVGPNLSYTVLAVADDGGSWCSARPASGSANSATISVAVDFTNPGLRSGSNHKCDLQFLFSDGSLQDVTVAAVVTPANCSPGNSFVTVNRPQKGASLPAYLPTAWEVSVTDSCTGQPVTELDSLGIFFSNGDAPVQLTNLSSTTGTYSGSWTPTNISSNQALAPVGLNAIADGQISSVLTLNVMQQVKTIPLFSPVVNSASYSPLSVVAPCSWVSLFGSNLANGTVRLGRFPLVVQYSGDSQINAQIPCGLSADSPQDLVVDQGGAQSVSQQVIYASTAPAVFTVNQLGFGQSAVVWTTPSGKRVLADQNNPVPAGSVVEIYATGLGLTSPMVQEGVPAPSPAPNVLQTATVTIGNTPAQVLFAGLSPGAVGLYQVNAVVPSGLPTGNLPIAITSGGHSSQSGATIAVK